MEKVNQFLDFELREGLFDIKDKYGLRPWEAVRFEVMLSVLRKQGSHVAVYNEPNLFKRIIYAVIKIVAFAYHLLSHRNAHMMFFLCSRDKKDGIIYDKIADDLYSRVDKQDCVTIESTDKNFRPNYKYGWNISPNVSNVFAFFSKHTFDFGEIFKLVKQEFPDSSVTMDGLISSYRKFISDYKLYKYVFKRCRIEKVFLVQNGIQKGMFAAANELGVKVIELQHGQISLNHPAYSYPSENLLSKTKIYHPNYLLTFSAFWSKGRNYPGVKENVIGNRSYAEKTEVPDTHGNRKFLVVSNFEEGELLAKRVEEILGKDSSFFFFFKLHPNQYSEFDFYSKRFMANSQVEVISNQQNINQLLAQCEGVFLNDSTVELEALRLGRKVFVMKEQDWQVMDFVLDEEGVYACSSVDDFLNLYEQYKDVRLAPRDDLFVEFNEDVAQKVLLL